MAATDELDQILEDMRQLQASQAPNWADLREEDDASLAGEQAKREDKKPATAPPENKKPSASKASKPKKSKKSKDAVQKAEPPSSDVKEVEPQHPVESKAAANKPHKAKKSKQSKQSSDESRQPQAQVSDAQAAEPQQLDKSAGRRKPRKKKQTARQPSALGELYTGFKHLSDEFMALKSLPMDTVVDIDVALRRLGNEVSAVIRNELMAKCNPTMPRVNSSAQWSHANYPEFAEKLNALKSKRDESKNTAEHQEAKRMYQESRRSLLAEYRQAEKAGRKAAKAAAANNTEEAAR